MSLPLFSSDVRISFSNFWRSNGDLAGGLHQMMSQESGRPGSSVPPAEGKALALTLLKEGIQGLAKFATDLAQLVLKALSAIIRSAWSHRGPLTQALVRAPAWLALAVKSLLSSRAGKAVLAALASIACVQLHYRPGGSHGGPLLRGLKADGLPRAALDTTLEAHVSLLFGAIK